jgi:hypothetical protein
MYAKARTKLGQDSQCNDGFMVDQTSGSDCPLKYTVYNKAVTIIFHESLGRLKIKLSIAWKQGKIVFKITQISSYKRLSYMLAT